MKKRVRTITAGWPAILLTALAIAGLHTNAPAQSITLDALQRDGYGMVPIKRPQPNTLTVLATVNDQKMRLIVDTGWGEDGLSLERGSFNAAGLPIEEVKRIGKSATGAKLTGITRTRADRVTLGNVEIRDVPLFLGNFKSLQHERARRTTGADGFLGAGFLRACSAVVDLHNLRVYLRPPGTGRRVQLGPALQASGLSEVSFQQTAGHDCFVDVEINGTAGKMFLDTGAYLAGVDTRFAEQIKATAFNSRAGMIDAAGVVSRTQFTKLRSFKIAGISAKAPDVRLAKFGFYPESRGKVIGLLGMDILGANGTIIDFGQQKLYFYPAN